MFTFLFDRQRRQISAWLSGIIEDTVLNELLLCQLKNHSEHMRKNLNAISSPEVFPDIFVLANSTLSKYSQTLIEINCKLEALLTREIKQWNSSKVNPFEFDAIKNNDVQQLNSDISKPVWENPGQTISQSVPTADPTNSIDRFQYCKCSGGSENSKDVETSKKSKQTDVVQLSQQIIKNPNVAVEAVKEAASPIVAGNKQKSKVEVSQIKNKNAVSNCGKKTQAVEKAASPVVAGNKQKSKVEVSQIKNKNAVSNSGKKTQAVEKAASPVVAGNKQKSKVEVSQIKNKNTVSNSGKKTQAVEKAASPVVAGNKQKSKVEVSQLKNKNTVSNSGKKTQAVEKAASPVVAGNKQKSKVEVSQLKNKNTVSNSGKKQKKVESGKNGVLVEQEKGQNKVQVPQQQIKNDGTQKNAAIQVVAKQNKNKSIVQVPQQVKNGAKKTQSLDETSQVTSEQKNRINQTDKTNTKIGFIKGLNLPPNKSYKGKVTVALSPFHLYIYFATDEILLFNNLKTDLQSHMKRYEFPTSKQKGKTIEIRKMMIKNKLGNYALLRPQHSTVFHRVKIQDWKLSSKVDSVTVELVDSGLTSTASVYDLYPISEELMRYPAFATKCHLVGLPKEAETNSRVIQIVRDIINTDVIITVLADGKQVESLPVMISEISGDSCLNKLILDELQSESLDGWDPMVEAYESTSNLYDFDVEDPAAAIYGYVGRDHERVCKLFGNTGRCFKTACRKEHVLLDSKGYTTDQEEVYIRAFKQLPMPTAKVLHVRMTHVDGPASFYCVSEETGIGEETLSSLESLMNGNELEMRKLLIPPGVGQVVLSNFPDGGWHRARVISVVPERDECTLFWVDRGGTSDVHFSRIRAIEPRYLHLPFQAIFCEIAGIGEMEETAQLAIDFLREAVSKVSTIEIISVLPGEHPHLLVNLLTGKGKNVADLLLKNNLVSCKENIQLDETSEYLPG